MKKLTADLETLREVIPTIFDQAQVTTANHRKNCVTLHKLHLRAAAVRQTIKDGSVVKLTGEKSFCDVFIAMTSRMLTVKKGIPHADRIVNFIGSYVQFVLEKASESTPVGTLAVPLGETTASRFTSRLLKWLLQGLNAKDKTIRYRSLSLVTELITRLGELDEDTYRTLRQVLQERVHDKDAAIRGIAVVALSKIVGGEDPTELPADQPSIMEILLDRLQHDEAAEVRRCALLHVPLTPRAVPAVLTRSRDVDLIVRKLLFATILSTAAPAGKTKYQSSSRLEHPRQLTLAQREKAVRDGLGDQEDAVRLAASRMVAAWFDTAAREGELDCPLDALVPFVKLFDIISPEGIDVAVDALKSVFLTRRTVLDGLTLDDQFWQALSPETSFIARVFASYCRENNQESRLEAARIPVVTALAFYLQETCNDLLDAVEELEDARLLADSRAGEGDLDDRDVDEALERQEDVVSERAFVVAELLRLTAAADFSDEIGRKKAFTVVREMLAHEFLPASLAEACMDVLKASAPSERDLIRVIVELVAELRDGEESAEQANVAPDGNSSLDTTQSSQISRTLRRAKSLHEMAPEELAKADAVDMRCLGICRVMLSRIEGRFDENSMLEGLLADLIIPAVKRKELALREMGLVNLGLCCLTAKNMALGSFQLFLSQMQGAPEALKVKVLPVIFDILTVYDQELLLRSDEIAEKIITFLLQTLEVEESPVVQSILCIGIAKLLLAGLVTDTRVLTSMVMAYVSPMTVDNQKLRQCLGYFLPVYCYSSSANQRRMQYVAMTAYDFLRQVYGELAEEEEMISPYQFGLLLVDWTDPRKLAPAIRTSPAAEDVHVDLATELLKALYAKHRTDEDRKDLCQLFGKLHIPNKPNELSALLTHMLLSDLEDRWPFDDPASEKLLDKFRGRFGRMADGVNAKVYAEDPRLQEVCALIGLEVGAEDLDDTDEGDEVEAEGHLATRVSDPVGDSAPRAEDLPSKRDKEKGKAVASPGPDPSEPAVADENVDASHGPTTTPKHSRVTKRTRSPGRTFVSPAYKKAIRQPQPVDSLRKEPETLVHASGAGDPFGDATNQRTGTSRRGSGKAGREKSRRPPSPLYECDTENHS